MRLILLLAFFVLVGCKTQPIKSDVQHDYDFYYGNTITGEQMSYHDDLDLRVFVSAARDFNNRLEQIEWALDITSLALNTELSDYNFEDLPPSPYLSINKLISVKHYLRLAGFNGQRIVVDPVNNMVIYLTGANTFFNNGTFSNPVNKAVVEPEISAYQADEPLLDAYIEDNNSDGEQSLDVINTIDTDQSLHDDTDVEAELLVDDNQNLTVETSQQDNVESVDEFQHISVSNNSQTSGNATLSEYSGDKISLSVNTDSVIDEPVITELKVDSGQSLRDIFSYLASMNDLDFVSSLGRHDWFLDSTINHEYTFTDLDHALLLILNESNHILESHSLGFLLKASLNNGLLDLYYE